MDRRTDTPSLHTLPSQVRFKLSPQLVRTTVCSTSWHKKSDTTTLYTILRKIPHNTIPEITTQSTEIYIICTGYSSSSWQYTTTQALQLSNHSSSSWQYTAAQLHFGYEGHCSVISHPIALALFRFHLPQALALFGPSRNKYWCHFAPTLPQPFFWNFHLTATEYSITLLIFFFMSFFSKNNTLHSTFSLKLKNLPRSKTFQLQHQFMIQSLTTAMQPSAQPIRKLKLELRWNPVYLSSPER